MMKDITINEREFELTKGLLPKRWEAHNIEIARRGLVNRADKAELANEFGFSKQNIHRIINTFMDTFIDNISETGIYKITKDEFEIATGMVDRSTMAYAINAILQNSYIVAAFRVMVLGEKVSTVELETEIDRQTIVKIIQMIYNEHLNNERVNEWECRELAPEGWVKINVELPRDKARLVAQFERETKSTIVKGNQND